MKTILLMPIIWFFFTCNNYPSNKIKFDDATLKGVWKISCEEGSGFMKYINKDSILIEANSNQIYILAKAEYSIKKDTLIGKIFLTEPDDLGAGGMSLNWDNYSTTKEIAEFRMFDSKIIELRWLGFFNEKSKEREWVEKIDWLVNPNQNNPICLQKCK